MEKIENKDGGKLKHKESQNVTEIKKEKPKQVKGESVAVIKKENNNQPEERDTTGDTKIFKIIRKEDIENEKRKQAIKLENEKRNQSINNENEAEKNKIKNSISQKTPVKSDSKPKYNNYQEKSNNTKLNNYQDNNKKEILNNYKENVKKNKNNKKTLLIILLVITIILLITLIISTIFGVINKNTNTIIKGVFVNRIELSGLTKESALEKLESQLNNADINTITVKYGDYSKEIKITDIDGKFDTQEGIEMAYNLGRNTNIVQDNYKAISTMLSGTNITIPLTYNEEKLEKTVNEINIEIPGVAIDSSYIIDNNKVIIKNSKDGVEVKTEEFMKKILDAFSSEEKNIEIPIGKAEKKQIDIESIHKEIYRKPENAYYTTNPRKIYKEVEGVDFAITLEEAKQLIQEEKEEYEIPLKIVKPQITLADLDKEAFPDLLSSFSTTYGTADVNRNTNIAIAARSINSAVVMPGETFSYNDLIGECSTRTGYKTSTIYLNGELSTGVGGGICQVSTTLYNTVLRANLEIVERRNHSLGVTYVPAGQDAMVSIGSSDFKFKNNRDYPIKVVAYTGKGSITCQIYGLKQDTEYQVKLESRTIEKTDKKYKVETFKVLYLNGKQVSRTWLSTDTYKFH